MAFGTIIYCAVGILLIVLGLVTWKKHPRVLTSENVSWARRAMWAPAVVKKGRRYAVVVVLVLAALITPADPFSMFVLAFPLYFLYELSILLCSKSAETPEEKE